MVYTMAIYAFYRITSAIISVVKHRKLTNPVLTASKFLGLATALMAIFSLQTAMIDEFGGNDSFSQIITPITGGWVCIIILCMAVFIIRKANKSLRALAFNKTET